MPTNQKISMTKEDYQSLLQSDYWKGFSYSLIKERNFTCQDCGRSFYNERNKLQVHHLVYRDIYPWSYKPEEMVVLCEDCHRKRHGLPPKSEERYHTPFGAPSYSNDSHVGNSSQTINNDDSYRFAGLYHSQNGRYTKIKFVLICVILLCTILGIDYYLKTQRDKESQNIIHSVEYKSGNSKHYFGEDKKVTEENTYNKKRTKTKSKTKSIAYDDIDGLADFEDVTLDEIEEEELSSSDIVDLEINTKLSEEERELSTLEMLERQSHANAVEQAKRAGVSTEGSTLDILERISHANAVEQAKRAGVSTEGSTLDILERISHANAVEQAKRAGVSTEGSTLDILERISHANAVEQAKRAGVSTEGSTLDILERISRKNMERYR